MFTTDSTLFCTQCLAHDKNCNTRNKGRKYDLQSREKTATIITSTLNPNVGLQNKKDFKMTVIDMLKDVVEKVGSMCEQMENFSIETKKGQMEMLDIKNSTNEEFNL